VELTERNNCEITGSSDLEPLCEFPSFPVFMGCVDQSESLDLKEDMTWLICKSSGVIQLKNILPLSILYPEAHGAGAIGVLWQRHHMEFAKFVNQASPSKVFEIGGASGILAKEYSQFDEISWTILEPNPQPIDGCKASFIKGFFDESFNFSDEIDTVVHSHVFEHIYHPDKFMKHLSLFMKQGSKLLFSLPNLEMMLKNNYTNCLNFEHTLFLSEPYIDFLLAKHGFRLIKKDNFMNDHSIFYYAVRDVDIKPIALMTGLYEKNKKLFEDYVNYHKELIESINIKIKSTSSSIYLFGAHIFSQYLIQMGLDTRNIISILDNDPNKQEKRLYGTSLKVMSPKILKEIENPIVILKAGFYNEEIKKDILENINSETSFFE